MNTLDRAEKIVSLVRVAKEDKEYLINAIRQEIKLALYRGANKIFKNGSLTEEDEVDVLK